MFFIPVGDIWMTPWKIDFIDGGSIARCWLGEREFVALTRSQTEELRRRLAMQDLTDGNPLIWTHVEESDGRTCATVGRAGDRDRRQRDPQPVEP